MQEYLITPQEVMYTLVSQPLILYRSHLLLPMSSNYNIGDNIIYKWTSSGTFTSSASFTGDILYMAGSGTPGGVGGSRCGLCGVGGVIELIDQPMTGGTYTITIKPRGSGQRATGSDTTIAHPSEPFVDCKGGGWWIRTGSRVIGTQDRVTDNLVDLVVESLIFLTIIRLTVLVVVDQPSHLVKDSLVVVEERIKVAEVVAVVKVVQEVQVTVDLV